MTVHPIMRTSANLACIAAAAALLSGCATRPQYSSQQEATIYRSHAGRDYTPPGPAEDPWGPYIREAAAKFDVPDRWIREVMHQESGGRLYHGGSLVTSGAGAMGLMQVMPATYDDIRGRYPELGEDPYDPHNNILAGTAYIREMYDIYGSPAFLAAYNAGPGRLDDYLTNNRTLPEETRRYVAAIGPRIAGAEPRTPSPGQQYAMNAVPYSIPSGPRYASNSRYSAPSSAPYAAPAGTPIRLSPQPEPAPVQMAAAEPIRLNPPAAAQPDLPPYPVPIRVSTPDAAPSSGPYIVLRPQPVEVAEAPPEPVSTPSFEPAREPVRAAPVVTAAALPEPPPAPRLAAPSRPMQFAQIPEPPRPSFFEPPPSPREPPRSQQQLAAASLVPMAPRNGFSLFSRANAEPIGMSHNGGYTTGSWAVQVGAFANEGLASSATLAAREHAHEALSVAHASVTPVHQPHGVLYRARLTGLSRDSATQACERLVRARTNCIIVSPDAAS